MKNRHGGAFAITHAEIAAKVGVSKQRVTFMLSNPDSGQNRARLMAALEKMGLNETAAKRFIESKNSEK